MKIRLVVTSALMFALLLPLVAYAQTPYIAVFFDRTLTRMDKDCPGNGIADSVFVVAIGFNTFVSGIDYAIDYPGTMTWLQDLDTAPVTIGTTPTGISEGWGNPKNGFNPLVVAKVIFRWACNACDVEDDPIVVVPNPHTGDLAATDFPDFNLIPAVGMTSLVCATVPTEDTTWGKIKSLYKE